MQAFKFELGLFIRSLTFFAFICASFAFYYTQYQTTVNQQISATRAGDQYDPANYFMRPQPNRSDYGESQQRSHRQLMQNALANLQYEYQHNTFETYPFLFLKTVHLNKADKQRIRAEFKQLTGQNIRSFSEKNSQWQQRASYSQFIKSMVHVDQTIGGHSAYRTDNLTSFVSGKKLTYHTALKAYQQKLKVDQVSRSFARLYSDYWGIIIVLLSVFPISLYYAKSTRENCQEVLTIRTLPLWRYLGNQYLAVVGTLFLLTLAFAIVPTIQLINMGHFLGAQVDYFAFAKTLTVFVLPTIMWVAALLLLLTQFLPSLLTMISSVALGVFIIATTNITGLTKWSPLLRFNESDDWQLYASLRHGIYLNRLLYVGLSLGLFGLAVLIKARKQGGVHGH